MFFNSIFQEFDKEIVGLMNNPDVNILLLVDHEALISKRNKLHEENIIWAIAFAIIHNKGTVIDLVAIKK